uniref:vomeronasal type-1 receptor 4-like n=1 Tax=Jaculus jaculus TaxID=51337 RepID=UPI001E1B0CE1|nr:vomeronasal type-1 receptor 4-like [Jaculus jaculus]
MGVMFLSQTALGVLGNCVCLGYFVLADLTGRRAKPTDLIVKHLTWTNFMVLLFKGIPQTMAAFGLIYFLDEVSCILVFYFYRVVRGVSLSSTSVLSIFQAIMISPSTSKWVQLKVRDPKFIAFSLGLCWSLQFLLNAFIPVILKHMQGAKNMTVQRDLVFCAIVDPDKMHHPMYAFLLTFIDVTCVGLMLWASGSMMRMLWKHKRRVQHLHTSRSPQSLPEDRATKSILAIVIIFLLLYLTSSILTVCFHFFDVTTVWMLNAKVAISACYPAFYPFLLLSHYSTALKLCCTCSYKSTMGSHIDKGL